MYQIVPRYKYPVLPDTHQISADILAVLEPARSDRELFSVKSVVVSATNVFTFVGQEKLRSAQP